MDLLFIDNDFSIDLDVELKREKIKYANKYHLFVIATKNPFLDEDEFSFFKALNEVGGAKNPDRYRD